MPETCLLTINNMPIVGRPIWWLMEGKHIAKLEITWQLPRQPTERWGNQQKKKKIVPAADGVTSGVTSKMAEIKMAAPTPDTKTVDDAINMAMCTSLIGPTRTPLWHSTPIAEDTTTDHSPEGDWKEVVSKKKKKKSSKKSPPWPKKEQPMVQQQRTPSPPMKVQRIQSPLQDLSREERRQVGATREYPLHEKYDLNGDRQARKPGLPIRNHQGLLTATRRRNDQRVLTSVFHLFYGW